jgi:anti-anti-sigma factor
MNRYVSDPRDDQRATGRPRRVLEIEGELGLPDVDRLQKELAAADLANADIVVGMEGCEFIDSLALAALLRARDRMANDGRRLVLAGPTAQVRRVLEVSGLLLDDFVFDSVELALSDDLPPPTRD